MSGLFDLLPQVRAIRTEAELAAVRAAAAADAHGVVAATHLVTKGGEVVGYGSIGGLMLLNVWVATGQVRARESAYLLNLAENIARDRGAKGICVPCSPASPFSGYMAGMGYTELGLAKWHVKGL